MRRRPGESQRSFSVQKHVLRADPAGGRAGKQSGGEWALQEERENTPSQTTAPSAAWHGPRHSPEGPQDSSPGAVVMVTVHPAASRRGRSVGSVYGSTGPRLSSTWWVSQITSELWSPSSLGRIGVARFLNSCFILKLTVTSPSSFCGVTLMKTPTLLAFRKAITLQGRKQKAAGSAKLSNNPSKEHPAPAALQEAPEHTQF